jgi:hypothetical protein
MGAAVFAGPGAEPTCRSVRTKVLVPHMEADVSGSSPMTAATDDQQERRLRVLLLDEGSTAPTHKADGARGREHLPGAVDS